MSAALATWIALITLTPVRRATSAQNEGPSSPFSCTIVRPASSTALRDLLKLGIDEDADDLALAPKGSADLRRVGGRTRRGLSVVVDQADRPGAEPHRLGRVVEVGDSAELDPHAPRVRETAGRARLLVDAQAGRGHPGRSCPELVTRGYGCERIPAERRAERHVTVLSCRRGAR